jgi:hypothetical protein
VSDPLNAVELGFYDEECAEAYEVKLVEDLAYLACSNGLHIVDISEPAAPVRVGYGQAEALFDVRTSLELRGDRAWFGNPAGIVELDISDPANPQQLAVTETGFYGPINLRAIDDCQAGGNVRHRGHTTFSSELIPAERIPNQPHCYSFAVDGYQ